jgi:hypothetical protein
MSQCPSHEVKPSRIIHIKEYDIAYYEHVSISSKINSVPVMSYPQMAVVSHDDDPILLVRLEPSMSGQFFHCSLDLKGVHSNYGQIDVVSEDIFLSKVSDIVMAL